MSVETVDKLDTIIEEIDISDNSSSFDDELSFDESDEEETDLLDPFNVQKDVPLASKASDYIKVESMVGDQKWNILVTPLFTVKDVIEKLSKRVDSKYKFFELIQTYEEKEPHLLNPELLICTIMSSWGKRNPEKYKFLFNFQEYKYVQIESVLDAHKWQIKLGPDATVGYVCDKLSNRIDSKYDVFELFLATDKKRVLLERHENVFVAMAKFSPDVSSSHPARQKFLFNYTVKAGKENMDRRPSSEQLSSHKSVATIEDQQVWNTDKAGLRKLPSTKKGLGKLPKFQVTPAGNSPNPRGNLIKQRAKFSSTSTLFLATTMSKPDVEELVHCMSKALIFHIEKGAKITEKIYFDIFDERLLPLSKEIIDFGSIPSERKVYTFIKRIYDFGRLDPECVIMALAYIEKIIERTDITLDTTNWRRVTFIALSVALKTWEDFAVYNTEFLGVFAGKMSIKELNILEMHFFNLIEFNVYLPASLYAKYYFELKGYSQLDEAHFPIKPLDKERAKLLELRTQSSQNMAKDLNHTISLDQIQPKRIKAPAIIG
jgi:hypothetical protein